MSRPSLITIDGPAAVGKSSLGRRLARKLGYRFIDTGAMYRAVARLALERHIDLEDEQSLGDLARQAPVESLGANGSGPSGPKSTEDMGRDPLTDPEVEAVVPVVARVQGVRLALVDKQRTLAKGGRVVMVGRDIGTIVLPQAELKLYMMASVAERARRRHLEIKKKDPAVSYEQVLADVQKRDRIDRERKDSPLMPAAGATIINTDKMASDQVLDKVLWLIESC